MRISARRIADSWRSFFRKRRLSMRNATDNQEEWYTHISPAGIFAALVAFVFMIFVLVLTFVAYSPVLELLPGYRSEADKSRENIIRNIVRLDSMERMMNDMLTYNRNIALIMEGKTPVVPSLTRSDSARTDKRLVAPNAEDSVLRAQMEGDGPYSLERALGARRPMREAIEMATPVEGIITERFDIKQGRFGIGIAAAPEAQVAAVDEGTVVLSLWTPETGYVIQLQHGANLLSVYRNLSQSLVTPGQRVRRGEVIGTNADAPADTADARIILYELWNNGKPVDPEGYIVFR